MSTTQVYRVYIKTDAQKVWDAITKREWTERYGYGGWAEYDLTPGAKFEMHPSEPMIKAGEEMGFPTPDVIVDGEVLEAAPPNKLVLTWRMLMDPTAAAEGFTKLTYEIAEVPNAGVRLTVTHELDNAPSLAAMVAGQGEDGGAGGGWAWVLSDLKSLLETGKALAE